MFRRVVLLLACAAVACGAGEAIPGDALILDLDASKGVTVEDGDKAAAWRSELPGTPPKDFVKRDEGRKVPGSGRPTLRKVVPELDGKPALGFRQQELCCLDEGYFDALTTGSGNTWIAIISVHEQRSGLKDVNSFLGNLRNGGNYEGLWACVDDDNTLWYGTRNGRSFGRFDANNPKLTGPKLEAGKFHLVAGRMAAGTGDVRLELFVDQAKGIATGTFPVNPEANPSRMAVGRERDATEHPGHESFDGEIARLLIWNRPLTDAELEAVFAALRANYSLR